MFSFNEFLTTYKINDSNPKIKKKNDKCNKFE